MLTASPPQPWIWVTPELRSHVTIPKRTRYWYFISFHPIKNRKAALLPNRSSTRAGAFSYFQLHPLTGSFRCVIDLILPLTTAYIDGGCQLRVSTESVWGVAPLVAFP